MFPKLLSCGWRPCFGRLMLIVMMPQIGVHHGLNLLFLSTCTLIFVSPVRIGGAGNKSRYADYGSDEALILPGHQRAAVLQGICLRNAIQTLSTVMEQKIFPTFKTFKCRILTRFGMKGVVAGVPRRPIIPNPCETMDFVVNYVSNMTGLALNEPIFVKDLQPTLLFDRIPEISAADRHNRYASFMKGLRKRNACAALDDDN